MIFFNTEELWLTKFNEALTEIYARCLYAGRWWKIKKARLAVFLRHSYGNKHSYLRCLSKDESTVYPELNVMKV
jgi:hypothetical protein